MTRPGTWYADEHCLLEMVRKTNVHWGHVPRIEGYDMLVEERRGGQGVVYRARHCPTNRIVAIKVLLDTPSVSGAGKLRFEREVAVISRLRHPNIVRVRDSGLTREGRLFYVMDWVEGKALDDPSLRHSGDLGRTLALFAKICDAAHYAHQRGVIHRDLKPSNILVDDSGEVRILDFGLAKVAGERPADELPMSTLSHTGQFLGSLAWASPEQVDSDPDRTDVRSDVYALGVILYQLLTSRLPHPVSSNLRQLLNDISTAPPPSPRSLRSDIPEDIETIVLHCLAKEPERRYQTAGDLALDIRRFVAGEPIDARRDNKGYVLRKTLARHKAVTALGAVLLLSVLAFSVTMTVLYRRAADSERRARANLENARAQAEKADSVRRFLEQMLLSVDPRRDGRDIRMIEVLERASSSIAAGLKGQWELEAALRATIGLSYRALGILDKAAQHLERALELRTSLNGEEHRDTLVSLNELAVLRVMQGDLPEAEALLERSLDTCRRLYGEDDALVRYALSNLAALRNVQGRFSEAERLLRRLLDAQLQTLGETNPKTIRTLHNLAVVLSRADKQEEGLQYCRRALELHKRVHGPDHVHTLRALGNLGNLLMEGGDLSAAESLLLKALEANQRLLGKQHPETVSCLHNVAVLRRSQGRDAEALALAREVLEAAKGSLPPGHLKISRYRNHLGACLTALGRFEEAEQELTAAHRSLREQLGEDHLYTKQTASDLVRLYESWNKPVKSAEWRALAPASRRPEDSPNR